MIDMVYTISELKEELEDQKIAICEENREIGIFHIEYDDVLKAISNLEKTLRGFDVSSWLFKTFPDYLYRERYFQEKERVLFILEQFVKMILNTNEDLKKYEYRSRNLEEKDFVRHKRYISPFGETSSGVQ